MSTVNHRFQVELPGGWTDGTIHTFLGPEDDGVEHQIQLQIDPKPETKDVEEFARARLDAQRAAQPDHEILQEERVRLPSDEDAFICVSKFVTSEDQPLFRKQLYLMRDGCAFVFAGVFTKKTIQTVGADLDLMVASLRTRV